MGAKIQDLRHDKSYLLHCEKSKRKSLNPEARVLPPGESLLDGLGRSGSPDSAERLLRVRHCGYVCVP